MKASGYIAFGALLSSAGTVLAQEKELPITFVTDTEADVIYRLRDGNDDFDYDDPDETIVFFDSAAPGATVSLADPVGITTSPDDFLYVIDSTLDQVVCMEDLNDDGDCHDALENFLFFDGTLGGNQSGIRMGDPRGVVTVLVGTVWVANSSTDQGDPSAILRLEDGNADMDANDAGEALAYYVPSTSGSALDSLPTAVEIGADGCVYYVENSTSGLHAQGVYKLEDLDRNGTIQEATERLPFFLPGPQPSPLDLIAIDVTRQETDGPRSEVWFLLDRGNDSLWRLEDVDGDGAIDPGNPAEATSFWTIEDVLDISTTAEEGLLAPRFVEPDTVRFGADSDASGSIDLGEVAEVYDELSAPVDMALPHGIDNDFHGHEDVGAPYCAGTSSTCPCGNGGDFGSGCANSTGDGANLEGEGTSSVALDDLEFHCTGLPNQTALLFVGAGMSGGGMGHPFNDGLLCVSGPFIRLQLVAASGGEAEFGPGLGQLGGWQPGDTRYFQVWYRDPVGGPCGTSQNMSNAVEILFTQ